MAIVPDLTELGETIVHMEARFDADPRTTALMERYRVLCDRFTQDLADPRDVAVSRAAALMMVKYQLD